MLFSSASGVLGAPGQSPYAAANAFLDGLAHDRRAAGRRGLSIDWGAWADTGMAARLDARQQQLLAARGVTPLDPALALDAMQLLMSSNEPQAVVAAMDWGLVAAHAGRDRVPLLEEVVSRSAASSAGTPSPAGNLLVALSASAPQERREVSVRAVRAGVVQVLGLGSADAVDEHLLLAELGLDSLMAVELANHLASLIERPLPATLALELPTISDVVGHLEALLSDQFEFETSRPGAEAGSSERASYSVPEIAPTDRERDLAASSAQQRMLFLEQFSPGVPLHNIPLALRLHGDLRVGDLEAALNAIVARHEALRTTFDLVDGSFVQHIGEPRPLSVPVIDLRGADDPATALPSVLRVEASKTFDLGAELPLRAVIVRCSAGEHVLLITVHHVAADGWSAGRLALELGELYAAAVDGREAVLPELPIQYADYAASAAGPLGRPGRRRRPGLLARGARGRVARARPPDRPPAARGARYRGGTVRFELPATVMDAVDAFSREAGVTPFVTLLSPTRRRSPGSPARTRSSSARRRPTAGAGDHRPDRAVHQHDRIARSPSTRGVSFTALVDDVRRRALGAFSTRTCRSTGSSRPCARPVTWAGRRSSRRCSLPEHAPSPSCACPGSRSRWCPSTPGRTMVDLGVQLIPGADGASGDVEFNADVFDAGSSSGLVEAWTALSAAAVATGHVRSGRHPCCRRRERDGWSECAVVGSGGAAVRSRVEELVEAQVGRAPDAVAVGLGWGGVVVSPSCGSGRIGWRGYLQSVGVRPGDLVGCGGGAVGGDGGGRCWGC